MYELNHSIVSLFNSECIHCNPSLSKIYGDSIKNLIISFLEKTLRSSPFLIRNPTSTTVYGGLDTKLRMFSSKFLTLEYEFKNEC